VDGVVEAAVALEILLLPVWAGAVCARPWPEDGGPRPSGEGASAGAGRRLGAGTDAGAVAARLVWTVGPVALAAPALAVLGAAGGGPSAAAVLRSQAVAGGFAVLVGGLALLVQRLAGPRAAQCLAAVGGWTVLAAVVLAGPVVAVVLAGPVVPLVAGPMKTALVRGVVAANPLVAAEGELGLAWLRADLTYRLTPLGESYGYALAGLAWWKTLLAHLFVGSGLAVFSIRRPTAPAGLAPTAPASG